MGVPASSSELPMLDNAGDSMTDTLSIHLEGLGKLQKKLGKVNAAEMFKGIGQAVGEDIKSKAAVYPSEPSPANPKYKYVRGSGTQYVPTGTIRHTSERLGTRWSVSVKGFRTYIENLASYAGYVHGTFQAAMHKRTGWKQLNEVAKGELPAIRKKVQRQLQRILRG